jgi:hypothetical protein
VKDRGSDANTINALVPSGVVPTGDRRLISTGSPFEKSFGYSRVVVDGDHVFVSARPAMTTQL